MDFLALAMFLEFSSRSFPEAAVRGGGKAGAMSQKYHQGEARSCWTCDCGPDGGALRASEKRL